jgi:hypothetical protein
MTLNWILEMGEKTPSGVSWLRRGSCERGLLWIWLRNAVLRKNNMIFSHLNSLQLFKDLAARSSLLEQEQCRRRNVPFQFCTTVSGLQTRFFLIGLSAGPKTRATF